jgi:O-antigen/teichoic acid export membrane protein
MDDTAPDDHEPPVLGTSATGAVAVRRSGGTWVAVGMAAANLLGYALNLVASRVLGPTGFGALGALLGVVLIGNVAALGLQTVTARVLVGTRRSFGAEAARLYRLALASALAVGGLTLAAAPVLAELLHLTDAGSVWWLPLVLAPLTVTGVQLGILQGAERFRRLALLYVVAAAGKVGGGLVGVVVGDSVTATMAGTAVGSLLSVLVGHAMVRGLLAPAWGGSARAHLPELLHAAHTLLVLFVLTNVDVLLARHYLPGPEAGRYAVGAVVAKGTFWLPSFVGVVALPALSDSLRRRRAAVRAIAAVSACGLAVTLFCAAFGDFVVLVVGGPAYESLAPRVWMFAAAGSLYALAQLLLYSRLAARDRRALVAVWAALAFLLVLVLGGRHGSTTQIIGCVLVAATGLVATGVLAELHEHRRKPEGAPAAAR